MARTTASLTRIRQRSFVPEREARGRALAVDARKSACRLESPARRVVGTLDSHARTRAARRITSLTRLATRAGGVAGATTNVVTYTVLTPGIALRASHLRCRVRIVALLVRRTRDWLLTASSQHHNNTTHHQEFKPHSPPNQEAEAQPIDIPYHSPTQTIDTTSVDGNVFNLSPQQRGRTCACGGGATKAINMPTWEKVTVNLRPHIVGRHFLGARARLITASARRGVEAAARCSRGARSRGSSQLCVPNESRCDAIA